MSAPGLEGSGEVLQRREAMLGEAKRIAEFLNGKPGISGIGISGSLARGKEDPRDIDLVILIDNDKAIKFFSDFEQFLEPEARLFWLAQEYCFEKTDKHHLYSLINSLDFKLDVLIIPREPDQTTAALWATQETDPEFLMNIINDLKVYNPESHDFKPTVFPEEIMKLIVKEAEEEKANREKQGSKQFLQKDDRL